MKSFFRAFVLSFSFLSLLPLGRFFPFVYTEKDYKNSILFFPFIGFCVGCINFLLYTIFEDIFSLEIVILIILFIQYLLFNIFHFDGFLDFFEAIYSGKKNKSDIIAIMKDPRIGSFGLFFGIFYLLFKFFLLRENSDMMKILFLYPIIGRVSQVLLMGVFSPAKKEGLGYMFKDMPYHITIISYFLGFVLFLINGRDLWPLYMIVPLSTLFLMGSISQKKLGGFTGDVVGATNEMAELLFLFLFLFLEIWYNMKN